MVWFRYLYYYLYYYFTYYNSYLLAALAIDVAYWFYATYDLYGYGHQSRAVLEDPYGSNFSLYTLFLIVPQLAEFYLAYKIAIYVFRPFWRFLYWSCSLYGLIRDAVVWWSAAYLLFAVHFNLSHRSIGDLGVHA